MTHNIRAALTLVGALVLAAMPVTAWAGYYVIGPVTALECTGFIMETCRFRRVDAVRGADGQLYEFKDYFDVVDEFRGNRCFVRMRWFRAQTFLERQADGSYQAIDADELSFNCRRV